MRELAEPMATRIVREITGSGLHEEETKVAYVPPSMTKRGIYERFCFDRGWYMEKDGRGRYTEITERSDSDWGGKLTSRICLWMTFRRFWQMHYPNLCIRSASEDIWGECYKVANRSRYGKRKSDDDDDDVDGEDVTAETEPITNNSSYLSFSSKWNVKPSNSARSIGNDVPSHFAQLLFHRNATDSPIKR